MTRSRPFGSALSKPKHIVISERTRSSISLTIRFSAPDRREQAPSRDKPLRRAESAGSHGLPGANLLTPRDPRRQTDAPRPEDADFGGRARSIESCDSSRSQFRKAYGSTGAAATR